MEKEYIRKWPGTIIGSIETDGNGNKTVRAFNMKILGYYDKAGNVTKDFYGRILYTGDMSAALLITEQ